MLLETPDKLRFFWVKGSYIMSSSLYSHVLSTSCSKFNYTFVTNSVMKSEWLCMTCQ